MTRKLHDVLGDLVGRIDPNVEQSKWDEWQAFWDDAAAARRGGYFHPSPRPAHPPGFAWPEININDAVEDFDLMLISQLKTVSDNLNGGRSVLCVRCNYGTGIMPMLFGCGMFMMPRETNTLPAGVPLGSVDAIRKVVERGVPDVTSGIGAKVFACAERFLDAFAKFPAVGEWVELYHPDLQGPIDVAEVVWGSDIFYAFYDEPDLVRQLLELVTRTYEDFMRRWFALVPNRRDPYTTHWADVQRGWLMLRNDSLMNLSPEIYRDFIRPFDQRLLDEFHGGAVHFCGRADHYIEAMCQMRNLYAVQLSQPHLNDMEAVYRNTVDKGIRMLGLDLKEIERAHAAGRPLRGLVHTR